MIVIDSIDFTWVQPSPNQSETEDLIHDFMTLTGIKVGHVHADGAGELARSSTFKEYCKRHNIVIEEVPAYTLGSEAPIRRAFPTRYDRWRRASGRKCDTNEVSHQAKNDEAYLHGAETRKTCPYK